MIYLSVRLEWWQVFDKFDTTESKILFVGLLVVFLAALFGYFEEE